nr:MAG TPA: PrsA1, PPIase, post-translocation chaperone, secretion [Caudoviricetes sp.]
MKYDYVLVTLPLNRSHHHHDPCWTFLQIPLRTAP